MPATFIVKLQTAKSGSLKRTRTTLTDSLQWLVLSSEPVTKLQAEAGALAAGVGVVGVGGDYPGTTGSFWCTDAEVKPDDDTRCKWLYVANFDSSNVFSANPLTADPLVSVASESVEETYYEDKASTPKLARHTNGIPFTELPKRDVDCDVITIEKNVATSVTNAALKPLRNKTNSDSVTIDGVTYAAGKLRITSTSITATKNENGTDFRTQTIVVKENPNGWKQKFESVGFKALISSKLQPIVDPATNQPVTNPWPLTSAGAAAATQATKGYEIELQPYAETTMSGTII